jgi:hypothetical protein
MLQIYFAGAKKLLFFAWTFSPPGVLGFRVRRCFVPFD